MHARSAPNNPPHPCMCIATTRTQTDTHAQTQTHTNARTSARARTHTHTHSSKPQTLHTHTQFKATDTTHTHSHKCGHSPVQKYFIAAPLMNRHLLCLRQEGLPDSLPAQLVADREITNVRLGCQRPRATEPGVQQHHEQQQQSLAQWSKA